MTVSVWTNLVPRRRVTSCRRLNQLMRKYSRTAFYSLLVPFAKWSLISRKHLTTLSIFPIHSCPTSFLLSHYYPTYTSLAYHPPYPTFHYPTLPYPKLPYPNLPYPDPTPNPPFLCFALLALPFLPFPSLHYKYYNIITPLYRCYYSLTLTIGHKYWLVWPLESNVLLVDCRSGNSECLFDSVAVKVSVLPGQVMSTDYQCKDFFGQDSGHCDVSLFKYILEPE